MANDLDLPDSLDAGRVMAEIEAEVRRRRANGDLPPSLEQELDQAFERFAPVDHLGGDFGDALEAADRTAVVNLAVPIPPGRPAEALAKRALRKGMAWYVNYLAQQVNTFGSATVRSLRLLGDRVSDLEAQAPPIAPVLVPPAGPNLSEWQDLVLEHLGPARGRVLHAECGDGALVDALVGQGVDAYGVDPRPTLVDAAVAAGRDAWPDDPLVHLAAVGDQGLGGLVLSGWVDRASVDGQRRLVALAAAKLAPGASVVVISTSPRAWARVTPPVEADLAGGRPLHPETWSYLLGQSGFVDVATQPGPAPAGLQPLPGGDAAAASFNARLDQLNQALFGPGRFAVVAARGR